MATITQSAEEQARDTHAARFGRDLTDNEWTAYRSRLLAYVRLLRRWEVMLGSSEDLG